MMIKHRKTALWALGTLFVLSAMPAWASNSISFTLNGKAISAVPLDKLGQVTVTVKGSKPFKQLWAGQWQGIDQSLQLVATPFQGTPPSLDKSHTWRGHSLARTNYDSTWAGKTSASDNLKNAGKADALRLFEANSGDTLIFSTRFRRQVYTGKTVWEDGGYVKQTRWETVGPHSGQATLKLEPPTFAAQFDPGQIFAGAVSKFNETPENKYQTNRAMDISRTLLYPTSYGGREVDFIGSKVLGFEKTDSKPVFNWNYFPSGEEEYIQAHFQVNMKIEAVMNTKYDNMPVPMSTKAVFNCPIKVSANRKLSESSWSAKDLEYNNDIRDGCITDDGKKADAVIKSANPLENLKPDSSKSPTDQAQDILKGLGF